MRQAPIVQSRVIHAPRERVFAAWGDAAGMSDWLRPAPDMTHASVEIDFRKGGRYAIVMHGEAQDYAHDGQLVEVAAPERLVLTWISRFMPEGAQETRVTIELEDTGDGGTALTLVHDELPEGDHYEGHVQGWAEILRKLAEALE